MNLIDRYYEIVNPEKALHRERNRTALGMLRDYSAAKPSRGTGTYGRKNSRAAQEVSKGHRGLAGGAQELVRNTALGKRIKAVIASNIVGTGIVPDYISTSKRRLKNYREDFDSWATSTNCDYEGHLNFYGLQYLWAGTVAESGGVFVRKIINNAMAHPLVLQTLEQQYLDESKSGKSDGGSEVINGIKYSKDGLLLGYWLKTRLGVQSYREESEFFPAEDIVHFFHKDRPGQHLGVSWFHAIADLVEMRQEWRDAALTQQRIAACFGLVIQEPPKDMGLGGGASGLRDEDGVPYSEVEPGMIAYTDKGTEITNVSPPNLSGNKEFNNEVIQDIAVGVGITREQLSGDFSKVTWASGRLARGEFYSNLDQWQNNMMIPRLNRIHDWFDQIYGIKVSKGAGGIKRNWIIPHRSAVNPKEELEVDILKVRTAAMTPQQFTRKHGLKFEDAIEAWKEAKVAMGDLPFDFDPSKYSAAGNQLDDNDSASSNQKKKADPDDKPKKSDKSTDDQK